MPIKKIAIVGTQGVPASYGGFETLVENIIGQQCSPDIQYTIFCSSKDLKKGEHPSAYRGAFLKYTPLHANGIQSIPYDIWSLIKTIRGYDAILVLGTSGCSFLPLFRVLCKKRLIVNIDGLEHRRAKWGKVARWILRISEAMAVRVADVIIADNKGIQDYVRKTYSNEAALIAYGGDHVKREIPEDHQCEILSRYGLSKGEYAISVCRIEPENNCHITLDAFSRSNAPLVFIGNWNYSVYAQSLKEKYSRFSNIKILDAIYDLDTLFTFRSHAKSYIHGHSAGGTNPSLVEAMFFGRPIVAYDVIYNRETTNNEAYYFSDSEELLQILQREELCGNSLEEYAWKNYTWKEIARQYEMLY